MKWIFLMLLISFNSFSNERLDWSDVDSYEDYVLNQEINLENGIVINKGERFNILDKFGGEIPAIYYQAHLVNCSNPDLTSEIVLVNPVPEDTSTNRAIGVQLTEGCNLDIWVETKDYYSPSIFNEYKIN